MIDGRSARWSLTMLLAAAALGCSTGEGTGWIRSEQLIIEECWNGPFDLQPTFFGANPYRGESLLIRVQRGDNLEEVSDGLAVVVSSIGEIRAQGLGQDLQVGLPSGVLPAWVEQPGTEPPLVSLALYLHDTCHAQNGTVYSIGGTINFASLFSGDPNESDGDDRLTEATFEARFADPRDMATDGSIPAEQVSLVSGYFRFYFQRGQPAQPFP